MVSLASGAAPFKATLAWTDFPSTQAANPHLNNDLDDGTDNDCDGDVDCTDAECTSDPVCDTGGCGLVSDPCVVDADCCSNKCRGPSGNQTCR